MMPVIIVFAILIFFLMVSRGISFVAQTQGASASKAEAKLIRKETHASTYIDSGGASVTNDIYQLVFLLDTGEELTFNVPQKAYGNAPENEKGTLTYQGQRFLGFEFRAGDGG
ncbi:MAG: DUF2500 domain-containing protein [Oscillospiraceae bacterium]|nr:DUF2500 domain-containing protein [Oscillospiraceae bacterium]